MATRHRHNSHPPHPQYTPISITFSFVEFKIEMPDQSNTTRPSGLDKTPTVTTSQPGLTVPPGPIIQPVAPPVRTPEEEAFELAKAKVFLQQMELDKERMEINKTELARLVALKEGDASVAIPAELLSALAGNTVANATSTATSGKSVAQKANLASGVNLQAPSDIEITIPERMVTDLGNLHEQPLDYWTNASLIAVNRHDLVLPKAFNPKGDSNPTPQFDWSFDKEKHMARMDGLEAMNNFHRGLRQAGYPDAVVDMFGAYFSGVLNYPEGRNRWDVVLRTFFQDRSDFFNTQCSIKWDPNGRRFQDNMTTYLLEGPRAGTNASGSGVPSSSRYSSFPSPGRYTPYDASFRTDANSRPFQTNRARDVPNALCVLCHKGHIARDCREQKQASGRTVIAKVVSLPNGRFTIAKVGKPDYTFCLRFNTGSCPRGDGCNHHHACTYCGSAEHGASGCRQ